MFEREAREPLFHPSLTHGISLECILEHHHSNTGTKFVFTPDEKSESSSSASYVVFERTIIIECYEILNSRFALEHRYSLWTVNVYLGMVIVIHPVLLW